MALVTGEGYVDNVKYPYAQIEHTQGNKDFVIRFTAVPPYKNYQTDELYGHIDFLDVNTNEHGRYANVTLPPRLEADAGKRRHAAFREFARLLINETPVPSPVFGT